MGLSGDMGWELEEPDCSGSMPVGVEGPPPPPDPPPLLCWRMKKAKRDGVLGLGGAGDSVLGLFRTEGKQNTVNSNTTEKFTSHQIYWLHAHVNFYLS